jgi:integrase
LFYAISGVYERHKMATIQKRVNADGTTTFKVQIRLKGFSPETATFERKTDANNWAQKIEADMRAGRHFGISKRHTFKDLANEYYDHAKDKVRLDYWVDAFGVATLDTITPAKISKQRDKLLNEETNRHKTPATGNAIQDAKREKLKRTGATVNRYLASLSSCLNYGVKTLQWIERNPCEKIEKPKENKGRVRFLSDDERIALLKACEAHKDLYLATVLALSTGARQSEVMTLRYSQIDFTRQVITLHDTKNGDKRALPLVGSAFALLQARAKIRNIQDDRVFPPSKLAKKSDCLDLRQPWEKALKAAGIDDFHWHDLRHTAASYMAMSGVSLVEISKILGHRTMQMVSRYSHLSEGHIVATGEKLAARLGI